jgi:hypothetical protein
MMKPSPLLLTGWTAAALGLFVTGCASPDNVAVTNPRQPGPAGGQAVGVGVGAVAGNVAGAVVGVGEGAAAGASAPFNTTTRVIRRWRTETTSDGRTIQVPEEILVDEYGRPISGVKK